MIVAVVPDRFSKKFQQTAADEKAGRSGYVRRPTRGIELKENTYATLRMVLEDGSDIKLVNAGAPDFEWRDGKAVSSPYSNFLIQSVNEDRMEKQQIVETFGEAFIFFFGERPRILNVQGVLINTADFNWEAEWWFNYDNYLRGTKCVEYGARIFLTYDDTLVAGYIFSASSGKQAQERNHVPFAFQLFVTEYTTLSDLGNPYLPSKKNANRVSPATLALYKPMLLGKSGGLLAPAGGTSSFSNAASLAEGLLRSGYRDVAATWAAAQNVVNSVVATADAILGNPVRIPQGFAGALVFDDAPFELKLAAGFGLVDKPVTYSYFGQNADEFVTGDFGDQYASASPDLGHEMDATFSGATSAAAQAALVRGAESAFADAGAPVPNSALVGIVDLGSSIPFVGTYVRQGAGKLAAGAAKAAVSAETAVAPIVNGALAVLDVGATTAGVAGALDRALFLPGPQNLVDSAEENASVLVHKVGDSAMATAADANYNAGLFAALTTPSAEEKLNSLKEQ